MYKKSEKGPTDPQLEFKVQGMVELYLQPVKKHAKSSALFNLLQSPLWREGTHSSIQRT
jgi:hypothetical protein